MSSYCIHFVYTYTHVLKGAVDREVVQIPKTHRRDQKWDRTFFQPWFGEKKNRVLGS